MRVLTIVVALLLVGCASPPPPPLRRQTIVIVHGAFGGGWAFRDVADRLTADGFTVYRPTLTGQGERVHLASASVDLDTHITDVVNLIRFEDLHDVVLVGHSYGGMVVTGVADRIPGRIARLIYLDAYVPMNGESAVDEAKRMLHRRGPTGPDATGYLYPTWVPATQPVPHDVPQPGRTFTQPIRLARPPNHSGIPTAYVLYHLPGQPIADAKFAWFFARAKSFGWPVRTLVSDHNAQWSHPAELAHLIATLAGGG